MPVVWTPDPAAIPWIEVQEDEIWSESPITAVDGDGEKSVIGYTYTFTGPTEAIGVVVNVGAEGVFVSAPNSMAGSFPPIGIEYQVHGITGQCLRWQDIPDDYTEIISYRPDPSNIKEWILSVSVHFDDQSTEVGQFVIKVRTNFTPGRDALVAAVSNRGNDARRT